MAAYICNSLDGTVSVINTELNEVTAVVHVGGKAPKWIAVAPDGKHVYATIPGDGTTNSTVAVIDAFTHIVTNVPVGVQPSGVAVAPDGAHVYVANSGGGLNTNGTVSVIATATNVKVTTVPGFSTPVGVAVIPDSKFVYVTDVAIPGEEPIVWVLNRYARGSSACSREFR